MLLAEKNMYLVVVFEQISPFYTVIKQICIFLLLHFKPTIFGCYLLEITIIIINIIEVVTSIDRVWQEKFIKL